MVQQSPRGGAKGERGTLVTGLSDTAMQVVIRCGTVVGQAGEAGIGSGN